MSLTALNTARAHVCSLRSTRKVPAIELFSNPLVSGQRVDTPFGPGEVMFYGARFSGFPRLLGSTSCLPAVLRVSVCPDVNAGNYKISLDWELDGGVHAVVFAQPDQVKRQVVARRGEFVLTPYGTGTVEGVRADGVHVVNISQLQGACMLVWVSICLLHVC